MKDSVQELADTTSSTVRGDSATTYALEPTMWKAEIEDAAKKNLQFMQVCRITKTNPGNKDVVLPYRTAYMGNTGTFADQTGEGSAVSFTALNNLNGLRLTPSPHAYAVAIPDYAVRVNHVDLLKEAKEQLIYYASDVVDQAIVTTLGSATTTTSSVAGAQDIYGGDAYSKATLAAGDIFTTDLVAKAKRYLSSINSYYYSGATETLSTGKKNPWKKDSQGDFILFIAPEQEEALMKDSQFINAAEYGNNEVVLNGEIGKYLGIKIVVSPNVTSFSDGGGSTLVGHTCYMVKANKCAAFAWGRELEVRVARYERELETDIILAMDYAVSAFYTDAIVRITVLDI